MMKKNMHYTLIIAYTLFAQQIFSAAFNPKEIEPQRHIVLLQKLCCAAITQNTEQTEDALQRLDETHPIATQLFGMYLDKALLNRIPMQSQVLKGHEKAVYAVPFSPDGTKLLSASFDGTMRLWEVATGNCLGKIRASHGRLFSVAFSPDGSHFVSGSGDGKICLWNFKKERLKTLQKHKEPIQQVAFSPDGTLVAASSSNDRSVYLIDAATLTVKAKLNVCVTHSLAFSPDGTTLAIPTWTGSVCLVDITDSENLNPKKNLFKVVRESIVAIAFSPDGTLLAGASETGVYIWNVKTGAYTQPNAGQFHVSDLSFSPDGSTLIAGTWDNVMYVWNVATGEQVSMLEGHTTWIKSVAYNPTGDSFASGSDDNTIRIWKGYQQEVSTITDAAERAFLLNAAKDWLAGRSHPVDSENPIYQALISRFAFLHDAGLFNVISTASTHEPSCSSSRLRQDSLLRQDYGGQDGGQAYQGSLV